MILKKLSSFTLIVLVLFFVCRSPAGKTKENNFASKPYNQYIHFSQVKTN